MEVIKSYAQIAVVALPFLAFGAMWGRYAAGLIIPFVPLICELVLSSLGYQTVWLGSDSPANPTWNDTLETWCTISWIIAVFLSPLCIGILIGRTLRHFDDRRESRTDRPNAE